VAQLRWASDDAGAWVELRPPKARAIPYAFDCIGLWAYGDVTRGASKHETPRITAVFELAGGSQMSIDLGALKWSCWSVLHVKLPRPFAAGARLHGVRVSGLVTGGRAHREMFLDAFQCYNEPQTIVPSPIAPQLPFSVRDETILPTLDHKHENRVSEQSGAFILEYAGEDGRLRYVYRPRTGLLTDLWIEDDREGPFQLTVGGGPAVVLRGKELKPDTPGIERRLVSCGVEEGRVRAVWDFRARGEATQIVYTFCVRQRSLILEATCPDPLVSSLFIGQPGGLPTVERIRVPYLCYGKGFGRPDGPWLLMAPAGNFATLLWDWYKSDASRLWTDRSDYCKKTDGRRNPMRDRLFITVSPNVAEVLPTVPNPPAEYGEALGRSVFVSFGGQFDDSRLDNILTLAQRMKRYGMDHLLLKYHWGIFLSKQHRAGDSEPGVLTDTVTKRIRGGDAKLAEHFQSIKDIGYRVAPFTDYVLTAPVCEDWDESSIGRYEDGNWRAGWYQYFSLSSVYAPLLAAKWAPRVAAKFGANATYCDQHTNQPLWGRGLDFDHRKPGAAMQKTTFAGYAQALLTSRRAFRGPVVSEGTYRWLYAGLTDGDFAQFRRTDEPRFRHPWLVDFDLRKLHPLCIGLGMGDEHMMDMPRGYDWGMTERLLCQTLAFGHAWLLKSHHFPWEGHKEPVDPRDPLGRWKLPVVKTYYLAQQLQARYAMVPVRDIAYFDGVHLVDSSEALRTGCYRRSQVHIEYANGLHVWGNGSFDDDWEVRVAGHTYCLPPAGWAAWMPGELLEYSAVADGARRDHVDSATYLFADARGTEFDFGPIVTDGAIIVRKDRKDGLEIIPLATATRAILRLQRVRPHWPRSLRLWHCDPDGAPLSGSERRVAGPDVAIMPSAGSFSVRLAPAQADPPKAASLGLVTDAHAVFEIPDVPKPTYMQVVVDPVFKTKITRISGDPGDDIQNIGGKWATVARHHYSKDAAWNCDQSLLHLGRHHGYPSMLFLDGTTYAPLFGRNSSPGSDMRWHPNKPDIIVYVRSNVLGYWNVRADTTQVIAAFPGYSKFTIGPWEGNLSLDGKMLVIDGQKGKNRIAFAYDLENKRKHADLVLNDVDVDWVSISASGKYMVLNGKIDGELDRTQVYDLQGNRVGKLWAEYGRPSHYDLTVDESGEDVAVGVPKSKPDSGRVIKRRLRDGKVTVLTPGGYASHTSTRNVRRPGWAYVTYQHRGPTWPPYWHEVVAVKLDGSMTVERLAHVHAARTDYLTEAHAVPSPDGRRVVFASTWDSPTGRPIGCYVIDLRGARPD